MGEGIKNVAENNDDVLTALAAVYALLVLTNAEVAGIDGAAMRGTDNAALAANWTAALAAALANYTAARAGYLDELAAANLPTDVAGIRTVVDAIPTTAMRGTDDAALAAVLGALDDAEASGVPTDVDTGMAYLKQLVTHARQIIFHGRGLSAYAVVTAVNSATEFEASGLGDSHHKDDFFNGWWAYVLEADQAVPLHEWRQVSDFVQTDGVITHTAFTTGLDVGDQILLLNPAVYEPLASRVVIDDIRVDTDTLVVGRAQIQEYPMDLDSQAAGSYALIAATDADLIIESLIFYCARDLSGDAGFTGISVETDDATEQVFIAQADGVKANLTAESQLAWTGAVLLKEGQYLQLTIYGGAVANVTSLCDIVIKFRAVVSGGYLA